MNKHHLLIPLLALAPSAQAETLFSNAFNIGASGPGSVGFLDFTIDAPQQVDIFTDGPTTDPQIFLFQGFANSLTSGSVPLAGDDDSCPDGRCGAAGSFNNALIDNIALEPGQFTVAVSDFPFTAEEAIAGQNDNDRTGQIRVSVATAETINPALGAVTPSLTTLEVLQAVAEIEQERARTQQVVRQTNTQIAQHLASEIARSVLGGLGSPGNRLAASADGETSGLLDAFWGSANYSHLGNDEGNPNEYSTDLYQFVGGVDKQWGDFIIGTSLTYVYGNTQQTVNDNNTHTIGITPYAAYKFNDYVFATLLAGYNYTNTDNEARGRNSDTHDYLTEFNMNGVYAIDSFFMKGRAGVRYKHTYTSIRDSMDADFDELTWLGDVEFGYRINENISAYTGALYEYRDQEAFNLSNVRNIGNNQIHDGVVYIRAGVDYQLTSGFYLGVNGSTEVNDEDNDLYTVGLNVRMDL